MREVHRPEPGDVNDDLCLVDKSAHVIATCNADAAGVLAELVDDNRLTWCERISLTLDTMGFLAAHGHHRTGVVDLLIAATAEHYGVVLLHYDSDYDRIAAATGQPTQWIVPRGTGR